MVGNKRSSWTDEFYAAVNPRVVMVGFQESSPGWRYTPVRTLMPYFDLWYMTAGRGAVKIDGRWLDFAAGDLVTMKPGQHYQDELADTAEPHVQYYVHVLPFGDDPQGLSAGLARRWPAKMSMQHQPRVGPLFADLFETFAARPEGYAMRLKSLMLGILEIVFAALRHRRGDRLPPAYPRLMKARQYIVSYNRRDLSLEEIAEHADLSASYLSALFRRYFGCSPIQYQIDVRLRRAKTLLARGVNVTGAAEAAGFHSPHYFSRTFKRRLGQTPSEFAAACRRK